MNRYPPAAKGWTLGIGGSSGQRLQRGHSRQSISTIGEFENRELRGGNAVPGRDFSQISPYN
jgi:hypothetical protein